MRNLIQKVSLASTIAVAGLATVATATFAQTAVDATVNFGGLVGSACSFANPTNGTLVVDSSRSDLLTSEPAEGAIEGSVELSCSGSAVLSVSQPVDSGSTRNLLLPANLYGAVAGFTNPNDGASVEAVNYNDASPISSNVTGPLSDQPVTIGMQIFNGGVAIPDGSYSYDVTVTATPL